MYFLTFMMLSIYPETNEPYLDGKGAVELVADAIDGTVEKGQVVLPSCCKHNASSIHLF